MVNEDLPFVAKQITAAYTAGMSSERRMLFEDLLAPLFAAFAKAEKDAQARIPSYLMAAIVAARAKFK